jgi:hypothetical protein
MGIAWACMGLHGLDEESTGEESMGSMLTVYSSASRLGSKLIRLKNFFAAVSVPDPLFEAGGDAPRMLVQSCCCACLATL